MKRKEIVGKLIKEGFSEKTLAGLSDKQLGELSERILSEQGAIDMSNVASSGGATSVTNVSKTDVATQNALKQHKKPFATYEGEVTEDEETPKEEKPKFKTKTEWLKSAGIIKDDDEDKEKKEEAKEYITPASQPVSRPGDKGLDLTEWVDQVVGDKVYPFTSKDDIMSLIQQKLDEQEVMEPEVDVDIKLPDWLTYDAIHNAGAAEPAEPTTKPRVDPGKTEPGKKPRTPYQPGPGINPAPKAEKTN